jgi:hypothetical protein
VRCAKWERSKVIKDPRATQAVISLEEAKLFESWVYTVDPATSHDLVRMST